MGRKNLNGAKTWLFPPYLLIISLLTSCILEVFIQPTPLLSGGHFQLLLGLLIIALALVTVFYTLKIFLSNEENPHPKSVQNQIFVGATFKYSRNPVYLAMIMILVGCSLAFNSQWYMIAALIAFVLLHYGVIIPEEKYLEKEFGKVYLDYKKSVRRWL